jgi:2-polyprenyl-3-methyl-5-hydroxy-6-metoxy-1,4-benzoquinol methylase
VLYMATNVRNVKAKDTKKLSKYVVDFTHDEKGIIKDPEFFKCLRNANWQIKNFVPVKDIKRETQKD